MDSQLVLALERLAQAHRSLLWEAAKAEGLTPLQVQALLYLSSHDPSHCRVTSLAREFDLTPATVSDAIQALEAKGLLLRQPWPQDGRVVWLRLTARGERLARRIASWTHILRQQLETFSLEEKQAALSFLMRLIAALQRAGVISVARMCFTCLFFQPHVHPDPGAPHHCRFLNQPLSLAELRVDCPDHVQPLAADEVGN